MLLTLGYTPHPWNPADEFTGSRPVNCEECGSTCYPDDGEECDLCLKRAAAKLLELAGLDFEHHQSHTYQTCRVYIDEVGFHHLSAEAIAASTHSPDVEGPVVVDREGRYIVTFKPIEWEDPDA